MVTVDFYYSLGSRYSYLASTQVAAIGREMGCRFDWRPIDGHFLAARRRHDPFEGEPVSGQYDWAYRELDAKRWAALYEIPYVEPRGRVDFDSRFIALAAVAAKRLGRVEEYSRQLFSAMFAEPTVRIDQDECVRRALTCGISEAAFRAELASSDTEEDLFLAVREADRAGVFGVPTFVVQGELFWGNDRLILLRSYLESIRCAAARGLRDLHDRR